MEVDGAQRRAGRRVQLPVSGPDGLVAMRAQHAGFPAFAIDPTGSPSSPKT